MSIYTDRTVGEYYEQVPLTDNKKTRKIINDPTKHYPNKDEAAMLRKIMAETGLNEVEVRGIKTYRKMLSDAQKQGQKAKRGNTEKYYQNLIKRACKETKLAREHPQTLLVLDRLLKETRKPWFIWSGINPSAKQVIEYYGK